MEIVLTTNHPVAQCVDLRATFTGIFRFAWDPARQAERPEWRRREAAWLTRIPCRYGFIYPHGGRRLAAYSTTRRRRLGALPAVTVVQGGPGCPEVTVTFDVEAIHVVAALLEARRPPRLSVEERGRRRDRMRAISQTRKTKGVWSRGAAIGPRGEAESGP